MYTIGGIVLFVISVCILLFLVASNESTSKEVTAKHRHPNNLRRKRKEGSQFKNIKHPEDIDSLLTKE